MESNLVMLVFIWELTLIMTEAGEMNRLHPYTVFGDVRYRPNDDTELFVNFGQANTDLRVTVPPFTYGS